MKFILKGILVFCIGHLFAAADRVVELHDGFLTDKGNNAWLVEFYAPWCGHCRKLEPVFSEVADHFARGSEVRVGRVDATRWTGLSHHYDINGFPTILFLEGESRYEYRGERSKDGIIEFAVRAKRPHIRSVLNTDQFKEVRAKHRTGVFFFFVGQADPEDIFWLEYNRLSDNNALSSYFYYGPSQVLPEEVELASQPTVLVFKDGYHMEYEDTEPSGLQAWFNSEKFSDFPKVNGAGLNDFQGLNKLVVVIVTDEHTGDKEQQENFKKMVKQHLEVYKPAYRDHLQFLWMTESTTLSRLTLQTLPLPHLLVLNLTTQEFYQPTSPSSEMDSGQLSTFLQGVLEGRVSVEGGTGVIRRLQYMKYDLIHMLMSSFSEAPILTLFVFGLPTVVVGFLIYALCVLGGEEDELGSLSSMTEEEKRELLEAKALEGDERAEEMLYEMEMQESHHEEHGEAGDGIRQRTQPPKKK